MFEYRKLRGRIIEKFGSQKAFAAAVGVSENTITNKLKCESGFSQSDVLEWSKLLDITLDEIPAYFFA